MTSRCRYTLCSLLSLPYLCVVQPVAAQVPLTSEVPMISGGGAMAGGVAAPNALPGPVAPAPPEPFGPSVVGFMFDGFGFDDNPVENFGLYFIPPDPIGAADTDRVIAVVNTLIEARVDQCRTVASRSRPSASSRGSYDRSIPQHQGG